MSIFNRVNDVLIVDAYKNVFERRSSEVFLPDVLKVGTVQKYMLYSSKRSMRISLVTCPRARPFCARAELAYSQLFGTRYITAYHRFIQQCHQRLLTITLQNVYTVLLIKVHSCPLS